MGCASFISNLSFELELSHVLECHHPFKYNNDIVFFTTRFGQSDAEFLVSRGSIRISYIFRLTFRSLSDVSYSDECRTKTVLSVFEKNVSAFSCNSEILQYQQIILIVSLFL